MKQSVPILLAAVMVVSMIAMVPLGAAQLQDDEADDGDGDDIRPGEQLSGVVGVQEAEVDGELDSRTFGIELAGASSEEARADVVADQLDRNEQRIEDLSDRQAELRQQREAGEITDGTYRAGIARNVVETQNVKQTTNQSAAAAADLPEELRTERGIDADRIETLRTNANELSGPEVAEIARGIAGDRAGTPLGPDRGNSGDRGGDRPGPDTDREQRAGNAA